MRTLILLGLLFSLIPVAAGDRPTVRITKVERSKQGRITLLDFFIKATDNNGIARIEYRAAVDGKQSEWTKYPYLTYPGYVNHLPFYVDCNLFIFEVRSVDKRRNKSLIVKRTFTNLR
jgi:hypothetical protein